MKCCCISCLITILIVVALICVALFVLTPEMIGIADDPIFDGQSLRDLGLHNLTLFNIIEQLTSLMASVDEADFIKHTEDDLNSAKNKLSLSANDNGEIDYNSIWENGLNNGSDTVKLTGVEAAAIIDDAIKHMGEFVQDDSASSGSDYSIDEISKYLSFSDLEITKGEKEGDANVKITIGIDIKSLITEMGGEDAIPAEFETYFPDGKTFITQEVVTNNHSDGGLILGETNDLADMLINGKSNQLIQSLLGAVTDSSDVNSEDVTNIQNELGNAVIEMFNSLGVHSIEFDENDVGYLNFAPKAE